MFMEFGCIACNLFDKSKKKKKKKKKKLSYFNFTLVIFAIVPGTMEKKKYKHFSKKMYTIITLSIGTDRPLQTV